MKKNPFSRLINHKILHKVGKQWVTLSIGLIMLLSGSAIACGVTASASQTKPQITINRINKNINQSMQKAKTPTKNQGNQHTDSVIKASNNLPKSNQATQSNTKRRLAITTNTNKIIKKAKNLHQNILRNNQSTKKEINKITLPKNIHTARYYRSRKYHRHYRRRTTTKYYWFNRNGKNDQYAIPYGKLGYFKKDDSDMYSGILSDLGPVSPRHVKLDGKARVNGYNFYRIYYPGPMSNHYWVLSDMLSMRKWHRCSPKTIYHFLHAEENKFLHKNFSDSEISDINNIRSRYNYLLKHENQSSTRATPSFRKHIIDWVNFYRNTIYNMQPLSENSDFDAKAQSGANRQKDQEDMNWGYSDPYQIVNSYVTDAEDEDNDGQTGHRDSVLDPVSGQIGVGQKGDVNALFMHWGWGPTANGSDQNIDYPKISDFPLNLAQYGEYWSIQSPDLSNSNHIWDSVYDETAHRKVRVKHTNLIGKEAYLKVDTNQLHAGHTYLIKINGNGFSSPYWYTTTLYNITPYQLTTND